MPAANDIAKMVIEVVVFAVGIYAVLRLLRDARGSGVARGLALSFTVAALAFAILTEALDLRRLRLIFDQIANFAILGLVIVFQPEIRRALIQIGGSPIFAKFFRREIRAVPRLLRGVARLSKERIGALIAIEREAALADVRASGIAIDAELNSYLIESIFTRGSPLHDGAMVVRENRIVAAKCLLPLSESQDIDKRLGTRHRAAVGLTEETDAVAVVVSEETGKISVALGGKLSHDVSLEQLEQAMEGALGARR